MDCHTAYQRINNILNQINFNELYPNFKKYTFAIYNSKEICLDGKLMPYDEHFIGNTCIRFNDEFVAIWNLDYETEEIDVEILAYCLVHEMFHCFQFEYNEIRFPNDLKLLNYPSDVSNYNNKFYENQALVQAYCQHDKEALKQFYEIRNYRFSQYSDLILEEFKVESVEGMAETIGLRALEIINKNKFETKIQDYINILKNDVALIFNIRRISYYVAVLFNLTLEKFGYSLNNRFDGKTTYEQNILFFESKSTTKTNEFIHDIYLKELNKKKEIVSNFMNEKQFKSHPASICGYDPMNMFRVDDKVYCSHFIMLNNDFGFNKFEGPILLRLKEQSDFEIIGYYK